MKALVFFLILAISAGAAFVTWKMSQQPPKVIEKQVVIEQPKVIEKETQKVEVVVARQDIPIGSLLKLDMLDTKPWPQNLIPQDNNFILREGMEQEVVGRVSRITLRAGEPILRNFLANPNDPSFLAAALKEGMRAVTIQIDGISGVAGFVYPGDSVDIMVTHEITLPGNEVTETGQITKAKPQSVTEVLVPDVRVMAIDQRYMSNAGEPPAPGASATVEVTPIDAQKLRLAETKGRLSFVLKALKKKQKDGEDVVENLPRPVGVGDLSRITPPSIFPVLYEGGEKIVPRTVQLEASPDLANVEVEKVGDKSKGDFDFGDMLGSQSSEGVSVVRGVQVQYEGVSGK